MRLLLGRATTRTRTAAATLADIYGPELLQHGPHSPGTPPKAPRTEGSYGAG